jgi:hypothetical protein
MWSTGACVESKICSLDLKIYLENKFCEFEPLFLIIIYMFLFTPVRATFVWLFIILFFMQKYIMNFRCRQQYVQLEPIHIWTGCRTGMFKRECKQQSVGKPTLASVTPPIRLKTFTQGQIIITHQVSPIIVIGIDVLALWEELRKLTLASRLIVVYIRV